MFKKENNAGERYNVESNNQVGGITVGKIGKVVLNQPKSRNLNDELKQNLDNALFPFKNKYNSIISMVAQGTSEGNGFVNEIKNYLVSKGWKIKDDEIKWTIFRDPAFNIYVDSNEEELRLLVGIKFLGS